MVQHNFFTYGGQTIIQILGEILYFPLWWYGAGLVRLLRNLSRFWLNQESLLGFSVWVKNIFVPMYGQQDIGGRFISFFMRLVQILLRGSVLLFWLAAVGVVFVIWVLLPPLLLMALNAQIFALAIK